MFGWRNSSWSCSTGESRERCLSNFYSEKDEIVKYIFGKDAVKLEKQFPGRLLLVRYEDLSLNTEETIRATEKVI